MFEIPGCASETDKHVFISIGPPELIDAQATFQLLKRNKDKPRNGGHFSFFFSGNEFVDIIYWQSDVDLNMICQ